LAAGIALLKGIVVVILGRRSGAFIEQLDATADDQDAGMNRWPIHIPSAPVRAHY
jgi:hypothetical protein